MLKNQVPIKTPKGIEEIEKRTYDLAPHLRRIPIMINGHSTVNELINKLMRFGEIESILSELEREGFVAVKSTNDQAIANSKPILANPQPITHHLEFNLDKAKGFIHFTLLGVMGPTAERRINQIESITTVEELRVELDAIHDMLPKVLSKREAQQAWSQLEPIMISINAPPP